jgi:hypothetical protein
VLPRQGLRSNAAVGWALRCWLSAWWQAQTDRRSRNSLNSRYLATVIYSAERYGCAGLANSRTNTRDKRMSDGVFATLWLLAALSAPAAIAWAISFYKRGTAHLGWFAYCLILLICAIVAYVVALGFGIHLACVTYPSGNLCGLFGFFVTGPLASSLTIVIVSWLMMKPADREPSS